MTFNFFRLVVLFTTPALRRAVAAAMAPPLALWLLSILLLAAGAARAATDEFSGGDVAGCTRAGNTYTCDNLSQVNEITIANGYTVEVSNSVSFTYFQVLKMNGSAALRTGGNLDLTGLQTANTQVAGGTLTAGGNFRLGSNDQTISADVFAASVNTGGPSTHIKGDVTATGPIALGSNSTITGTVSAATLVAGSGLQINGGIRASGDVNLSSGTNVKGGISGLNGGSSGTVTTGPSSDITGDINAAAFTLASDSKLTGDINAQKVELSAANAAVKGNIVAATSLTVGSGGSVKGNIDSPRVELNASGVTIKGDIKADTSLTIGSGNTVNGNVSGTTLTMASSGVTINGNVTMKGDVDIGSNGTINGDLAARNVTTHASGDYINGNAAVNAIFLDWGATVAKTITCTGPGAVGCSCVTKADQNYQPTCGPAPPSGVHHFRITHNGSALTCQPQTVTVTACANSTCTSPHYNGAATATLQPGGKSFTFTGGETGDATVEQSQAGTAILSASGALNPNTCVNTSDPDQPCAMVFATSGLKITATHHVAMAPGAGVTIQALTASPKNQSCVPLVANQQVNVNLSCEFSNPGPDKAAYTNVTVGQASLDCRGGGAAVPLTFDKDGIASAPLQYAEVGQVSLKASYTGSGPSHNFHAAGNGSFIAAPKGFLIEAVSTVTNASTLTMPVGAVFAKASEGFTVKVSAVNAETPPRATKNFGKENAPESITVTSAIANVDADGKPDPDRQNGAITAGQFAPLTDGAYASKTGAAGLWSFSDVGAIDLGVKLLNSTGYYMGYVDPGFKTVGAQNLARFTPDHFDTVLLTDDEVALDLGVPAAPLERRRMSCANLHSGTRPCPDGTGSFIHSGQPFLLKVLAYNGAATPALTKNYTGAFARPLTLSAWTAAGGAVPSPRNPTTPDDPLSWTSATASPATNFAFSQGVGKLAEPAVNLPRFTLGGAYPAADALPVTTYLRATEVDNKGASSRRADAAASVEAQLTAVSGRLQIANAYGSPNTSLPVQASAQYYMPVGYVFNPQVQLTSPAIGGHIKFDNCLKGLFDRCPAMRAADPSATLTLKDGKGIFRVAPPSPAPASIGTVDVSLPLLIPYLPSTVGRETFGIYRSGPVIYRREVY